MVQSPPPVFASRLSGNVILHFDRFFSKSQFSTGRKFLKKKTAAQEQVPDLDELETAEDTDGPLFSGSGSEVLFGV